MSFHSLVIGVIQQTPDVGGAEVYMYSLISEWKKKNSIIFATNNSRFIGLVNPVVLKTYRLPFILDIIGNYKGLIKSILLFPFAVTFYCNLLRKFKQDHVDVIVMSGFSEKMLVTFLSIFYKIPVIWIEYGPLTTIFARNFYLPKILYSYLKNIPYSIIVPAKNTFNNLHEEVGLSKNKMKIIPCGTKVLNKKSKRLDNYKDRFVIGNVSRLTREKGQHYVILAMKDILKEIPQAHLILIGDGPDRDYFEKLASSLNLLENVSITGFVKNLDEYYNSMDVFLFPSDWVLEGFGIVMLEAMVHKVPVIGNTSGPVPEIIENNKNGLLVSAANPSEIAKAVIDLYKNPTQRKKLGENGYNKALTHYNIEKIAACFEEVFTTAAKRVQ